MAYVSTAPAAIAAAATQLEGIGNSFSAESSAAAGPTTALAPAASDEEFKAANGGRLNLKHDPIMKRRD